MGSSVRLAFSYGEDAVVAEDRRLLLILCPMSSCDGRGCTAPGIRRCKGSECGQHPGLATFCEEHFESHKASRRRPAVAIDPEQAPGPPKKKKKPAKPVTKESALLAIRDLPCFRLKEHKKKNGSLVWKAQCTPCGAAKTIRAYPSDLADHCKTEGHKTAAKAPDHTQSTLRLMERTAEQAEQSLEETLLQVVVARSIAFDIPLTVLPFFLSPDFIQVVSLHLANLPHCALSDAFSSPQASPNIADSSPSSSCRLGASAAGCRSVSCSSVVYLSSPCCSYEG